MWSLPRILETPDRPTLSVGSIRQLARLGTLVRWPGVMFAAVVGLIQRPPAPVYLALLLIWVAAYNGWAMITLPRTDDASILRLGRALTLLDTVSFFALLAVFGGLPPTSVYAAYVLLIIWMVAYDGAEGAVLAVAIFVIGMIALQGVRTAMFHLGDFDATGILLWSLIMAVAAAIVAAFDRIVVGGALGERPAPADGRAASGAAGAPTAEVAVTSARQNGDVPVRLSPREQEVLRLVAEGYSNSMIATRLHLSENTIKTYVETLLSRLHARNRAEAVAAASRYNLI
jgi:DNA-binding CsgD family transcriptional regulator